jgi:hypothetical protein
MQPVSTCEQNLCSYAYNLILGPDAQLGTDRLFKKNTMLAQ